MGDKSTGIRLSFSFSFAIPLLLAARGEEGRMGSERRIR
jgi:hypothetical protein